MMVDGAAARALGALARERWARATGEDLAATHSTMPWPLTAQPDFADVDVAIARTVPPYQGDTEVREVEVLFHDMIARAERAIYIENQFLTCCALAEALGRRLREKPALEVLIVAPQTHSSWLESRVMRNGRIRFAGVLRDFGVADRVRLVYPEVCDETRATDTMVHAKVMIVDDALLRVGSANLNNRSMGTDSECDLAIEAASDVQRRAIETVRARLLADHCGVSAAEAAQAIAQHGLIRASETLTGRGHRLRVIDDGVPEAGEFADYIAGLADPERPIESHEVMAALLGDRFPARRRSMWLKLAAIPLAFIALAVAWQFPPLSRIASPDEVGPMLQALAAEPWAPLLVIGVYIVGGLVAFPLLLLIAATAALLLVLGVLQVAVTG